MPPTPRDMRGTLRLARVPVMIDRFSDPTRFAQDWEVVTEAGGTVEHTAGAVTLNAPAPTDSAAILARRSDGSLLIGDHHVAVVGRLSVDGSGYAIANADLAMQTYTYC